MFTFVPAYEIDFQVGFTEFHSFPQHKFRKKNFSFSFVAFLNRKEGILSKKNTSHIQKRKDVSEINIDQTATALFVLVSYNLLLEQNELILM